MDAKQMSDLSDKLSINQSTNQTLTWIGNSAFCGQFSQQDAKRPDVRLDGEAAVQSRLRGRPLDGELGSCKRTGFLFPFFQISVL